MKKKSESGSALLLVIIITTALTIFASSAYWVSSLMRLSVQEHSKKYHICLLTDGLADYAWGLLNEKKVDLSDGFYRQEPAFWLLGDDDGFTGVIEMRGALNNAEVTCSLFMNGHLLQEVAFSYCSCKGQVFIKNWRRF